MPIISRKEIVGYTPEQMYELVNDIKAYPQFLPWCVETTVHHQDEDEIKASLVISGAGLQKTFTTHNRLQKNKMIEIRLVDGPFKHLEGFWRFDIVNQVVPKPRCQIAFDLEFEFSGLLAFALGPIFHHMTSTLIDAFTSRAEVVYGRPAE